MPLDEADLSDCPYYQNRWLRNRPELPGKCLRGCWDEPSCVTDEPLDGWPSERAALPSGEPHERREEEGPA